MLEAINAGIFYGVVAASGVFAFGMSLFTLWTLYEIINDSLSWATGRRKNVRSIDDC